MQNLVNQMQKLKQELRGIESVVACLHNSQATGEQDTFIQVPAWKGRNIYKYPRRFPKSAQELEQMEEGVVEELLEFYALSDCQGSLDEKRKRLKLAITRRR